MKRLLLLLLMLFALSGAQEKYTDDSLLNIDYLKYGKAIITIPSNTNYYELREGSNIVHHNNQLIWISTLVRKVDKEDVFSLHRWVCPNPDIDLETWEYRGELVLKGAGGVIREGEDAYFYYGSDGRIYLTCEDKSTEKEYGLFLVNQYIADNWESDFIFQGGSTGLSPFGMDFAQDAVYSPWEKTDGKVRIFDGRKGRWTEEIGIAFWNGTTWIPNPEPIFTIDDIDQPASNTGIVLTTGIGDDIFEFPDYYIMEIVAFKDWSREIWEEAQPGIYNGYWCQGLAISTSLTEGWRILNSDIKDQDGNHALFNMFYSNGWKALVATIDQPNTIFLAEVVSNGTPPSPPPPPSPPSPVPVNGEKPTNLQFDNNIISWEWQGATVDKFDICATNINAFDWIGATQDKSFNAINFIRGDTQEFWVVAVIENNKYFSDRITVEHNPTEPLPPPPPVNDNAKLVSEIKILILDIDNKLGKIK